MADRGIDLEEFIERPAFPSDHVGTTKLDLAIALDRLRVWEPGFELNAAPVPARRGRGLFGGRI